MKLLIRYCDEITKLNFRQPTKMPSLIKVSCVRKLNEIPSYYRKYYRSSIFGWKILCYVWLPFLFIWTGSLWQFSVLETKNSIGTLYKDILEIETVVDVLFHKYFEILFTWPLYYCRCSLFSINKLYSWFYTECFYSAFLRKKSLSVTIFISFDSSMCVL